MQVSQATVAVHSNSLTRFSAPSIVSMCRHGAAGLGLAVDLQLLVFRH